MKAAAGDRDRDGRNAARRLDGREHLDAHTMRGQDPGLSGTFRRILFIDHERAGAAEKRGQTGGGDLGRPSRLGLGEQAGQCRRAGRHPMRQRGGGEAQHPGQ
ncbi:MAG: hypothetical protein WDN69_29800 [Aliidongia sp.]